MKCISLNIVCFFLKIIGGLSTQLYPLEYRYFLPDHVESLDDRIPDNSVSVLTNVSKSISKLQCSNECINSKTCVSFFYRKETRNCQMYGGDLITAPIPMHTEHGYKYYRLYKERPTDCYDIWLEGKTVSGVYYIYAGGVPLEVYCDQETDGGGWMVFQRRSDGSEDFYRPWLDYEKGFGNNQNEFWIGNKFLSFITAQKSYTLRVDLEKFTGETRYAQYTLFAVGSAATKYTLAVGGYTGDAGDSLDQHNGQKFSTRDQDNDATTTPEHCAQRYKGAWWYRHCHASNLNGLYLGGSHESYGDGIEWVKWTGLYYSMKWTEMKIRPTNL